MNKNAKREKLKFPQNFLYDLIGDRISYIPEIPEWRIIDQLKYTLSSLQIPNSFIEIETYYKKWENRDIAYRNKWLHIKFDESEFRTAMRALRQPMVINLLLGRLLGNGVKTINVFSDISVFIFGSAEGKLKSCGIHTYADLHKLTISDLEYVLDRDEVIDVIIHCGINSTVLLSDREGIALGGECNIMTLHIDRDILYKLYNANVYTVSQLIENDINWLIDNGFTVTQAMEISTSIYMRAKSTLKPSDKIHDAIMNAKIEDLCESSRVAKILHNNDIVFIKDIVGKTEYEIYSIRQIGERARQFIEAMLIALNIKLKPSCKQYVKKGPSLETWLDSIDLYKDITVFNSKNNKPIVYGNPSEIMANCSNKVLKSEVVEYSEDEIDYLISVYIDI